MSSKIQAQSAKVWQILTNPETTNTYKNVVTTTWQILKESAVLLWLILCLILVIIDWFWTNSIFAGRRFRVWVDSFEKSDTDHIASEAGKQLLAASKRSVANSISGARTLLGLPEKKEPALELPPQKEIKKESVSVSPTPSAAPSPAFAPEPTPLPTPSAEAPTAPESSSEDFESKDDDES